jgi:CRISPR-associated protein Cmr6
VRQALETIGTPDHVALAYNAWAPVGADGKVPDGQRAKWLSALAGIAISRDYSHAYDRWKRSFLATGDRLAELTLASRLLVGHGNASAIDIGITVHHTWGVPIIPGSALKGLVAHYVDATYGPSNPGRKPWEQEGDERTRVDYQGVNWRGRRIERGPGSVYRALFGAPDASEDDAMRVRGFDTGATAGLITFHDALYVPDPATDNKPFAADVLTVHQREYYNSMGGSWPNDYDSPNPIAFLTVRPGVRFLSVLSGRADWTELAEKLLRDAFERWGVGGKTSAGYGRLEAPGRRNPAIAITRPGPTSTVVGMSTIKAGSQVDVVLLEERTKKGGWKARHDVTGLEGPVQNSNEIPSGKKAGERIAVEVKIVKGKESAFRYLSGADAGASKGKK